MRTSQVARSSRLVQEAMAGVAQKSSRSMLTIIGIALGIGSIVAVLGVTSSANGQISREFDAMTSTRVTVQPVSVDGDVDGRTMRAEAEAAVRSIEGVEAVAASWDVNVNMVATLPGFLEPSPSQPRVVAASPAYWDLMQPTMAAGRVFDDALSDQPVAVVGQQLAQKLVLGDVEFAPTIFIDSKPFTVVGVVADAVYSSAPLSTVVIPADFARAAFGEPGDREVLTIQTSVGASGVVAKQVALAVDPRHPDGYRVVAPPPPATIRDNVTGSVQTLFLALALICILIGGVGVTNASLIGVMSRTAEIGLRRSLGALPRHILGQFLLEAGIRGVLGGATGANVGILIVCVVALVQRWTAVIEPWTMIVAPAGGAVIGVLAGAYPAWRASHIEPIDALRR